MKKLNLNINNCNYYCFKGSNEFYQQTDFDYKLKYVTERPIRNYKDFKNQVKKYIEFIN